MYFVCVVMCTCHFMLFGIGTDLALESGVGAVGVRAGHSAKGGVLGDSRSSGAAIDVRLQVIMGLTQLKQEIRLARIEVHK